MQSPWFAFAAAALTFWFGTVPTSLGAQIDPLGLACPTNFMVWRCEPNATTVTFPLPTTNGGNCRLPATVICTPPPGSVLPVGTHIISCRATNPCGESASCSFPLVVMRDTNAPLIECPADLMLGACGTE